MTLILAGLYLAGFLLFFVTDLRDGLWASPGGAIAAVFGAIIWPVVVAFAFWQAARDALRKRRRLKGN